MILSGDIDTATVADIASILDPSVEAGGPVIIDLSNVAFMDGAGVHLIIVRDDLALDSLAAGIDVSVMKGVVTLKGRAPNEKAKAKATALAKKVKGVVSVDNQLRLFGVD